MTHPYEIRWTDAFQDLDERPIYEYAAEFVRFRPPIVPPGPFDQQRSRHFNGPLDAWRNDRTREVNLLKPPRGGGTLVGDLCFNWAQANEPGDSMEVFQKDDVARNMWNERLCPMLRDNPRTAGLLPRDERQCTPPEIKLLNGHMVY